jgi:hypothetical protein
MARSGNQAKAAIRVFNSTGGRNPRKQRRTRQSLIETLELRRLLSTSVNMSGDAGSNSIEDD